jgi:hypothetical protein
MIVAAFLGLEATCFAQDQLFDSKKPLEIIDQGVFSVPGRYVEIDRQTIMVGQMYVQYQIPKARTRPYPVVMIHGGGQTASNFLSTPDGRRGWADDFVANGYLEKIEASVLAINSADDERNPPETGIEVEALKRVKNGRLYLIPASDQTSGHGTTGNAQFYKQQLQDFLQTVPRREM